MYVEEAHLILIFRFRFRMGGVSANFGVSQVRFVRARDTHGDRAALVRTAIGQALCHTQRSNLASNIFYCGGLARRRRDDRELPHHYFFGFSLANS
jgi:hypothetical protein